MNINIIKDTFNTRVPQREGKFKEFSVLVPLITVKNQLHLLFEVRSENLKTQPREICFPGGKRELNETPMECAVRETCEELNISSDHIKIFGPLDYLVLPYNLILYPFMGSLNIKIESIKYSTDEVSDIFSVPIDFFIENPPLSHFIEIQTQTGDDFPYHLVENGEDYHWRTGKYPVYFYTYKDHVIWGMTARIIKNLVDILNEKTRR